MIRIEIDNASATPAYELRAVAACLIAIAAGESGATHTETTTVGNIVRTVTETPAPKLADVKQSIASTIAAADRPDIGAPTIEPAPVAQGETLREPAIDPKVVFGQPVPNVPAATASSIAVAAPLPTAPAAPAATSTATAPAPLPPVPAAPAAVAPTDEDAPSDAQFDKTGLPWDARIHSRGRSMNSDGTWRAKRGVDDATVAAVVAELRGVPAAPAATLADDVAQAEASWPFKVPGSDEHIPAPVAAAPFVPPVPSIAPIAATSAANVSPVPANAAAAPVANFPDFMARVVPAVAAGQITELQVTTILGEFGIPSLPLLATRPDLLPTVSSRIDALIAGGAQ